MTNDAERIWSCASKAPRAALAAKVLAGLSRSDLLRFSRDHDQEVGAQGWSDLTGEIKEGIAASLDGVISELRDNAAGVLDLLATRSTIPAVAAAQTGIADALLNLSIKK